MGNSIEPVKRSDLTDTARLLRAYCDFYEVTPTDESLMSLVQSLMDDPASGVQLIARDQEGLAVGFATVYWTWQTLSASRTGVMNDLFVIPEARGKGWAAALIEACGAQCRLKEIDTLVWQTALDNTPAQKVYDRVGGKAERWLDYSLDVSNPLGVQLPGD
ncbi:MAG: GNAT family N-acetyltransferase [Solirubrobacterales bacterium]|nr:GNAT family N-acetyltransferase [Solirubrobacterales bacterium]